MPEAGSLSSVQRHARVGRVVVERHGGRRQLALRREGHVGGHALVLSLGDEGGVDLRIHRVGALHGVHQHHGGVVGVGAVDLELAGELGVVALLPLRATLHLRDGRAARGTGHVLECRRLGGQVGQLLGAERVAAEELHVAHAQLLHLAQHRAGLRIEAAVEDRVGLLRLDGGQDGHEIGGLVVGELLGHHLQALLQRRGLEHLGHALAVGRAVVDDGDGLELEVVGRVDGQGSAQGAVVGDQAERGLVARLGQVGIGGGGRDVRQAALVVERGRRDGGARLQVADHARHLQVAELLRDGRGLARVAGIVFRRDLEADLLAADDEVLRVEVVHRHAHAVFGVLADVRDAAGDGAGMADLDGLHVLRARGRGGEGRQHGGSGRGTGQQGEEAENGRHFGGLLTVSGMAEKGTARGGAGAIVPAVAPFRSEPSPNRCAG